ncbi:MAG: hypothetical protein COB07_02180 [Sulfurovum sp.]|nr:MAG: hypothetical protein COB07_02180 [Sulfurovum sp.]
MYHSIFSALSSKATIYVYTNDKEYREVFSHSKRIFLTNELEEADIVLMTDKRSLRSILYRLKVSRNVSKKPILFVTDYHFLKMSDDIVGAFYWRKGRSQLLFIKKRLQAYDIILPKEYQSFMIDAL